MSEIRKLIRLTPNTYAITVPKIYRDHLGLNNGDFIQISMPKEGIMYVEKLEKNKKHV